MGKVDMTFKYTPAVATNIRDTIDAERRRQEAEKRRLKRLAKKRATPPDNVWQIGARKVAK